MKKLLLLLPLLIIPLAAGTLPSKVIKASDYSRVMKAKSGHRGHSTKDDLMISSIEASSEASFQVTIVISLEASTQATSGNPQMEGRNSTISFLENNHLNIKKDISKGEGEHLITLLSMMKLKRDATALNKIQLNFDTLVNLESDKFLDKLQEINNS